MNLPWHKNAWCKLQNMIDQDCLPHALLITGVEKIGKFELMQQLVGVLLKDDIIIRKDNIRNNLDYPVLIRRSNYPNMVYCRAGEMVEKNKNRSKDIRIDQVRVFCDALNKTADELQIGVIFYGDQMNIGAANGLLKTLEEPRTNTLIIILAHHVENLPITIVSRCQNIHIAQTYDQQTCEWLIEHVGKTKKKDHDIKQLLESTHGVPFKVLSDLSDGSFTHYQNYQNQLLNIVANPLMIVQIKDFKGNELVILNCLQNIIIEGIRLKTVHQEGAITGLYRVIITVKFEFLFKLLDDIYHAIKLLKTTVNISLLMDNILIVWSHIVHLKKYPQITNKHVKIVF